MMVTVADFFQNVITIKMKGAGDTEDGMLTIPVSGAISTTGEGDIRIERSMLLN